MIHENKNKYQPAKPGVYLTTNYLGEYELENEWIWIKEFSN
jgi:hypothetical protein